jgi:hypothetical protein
MIHTAALGQIMRDGAHVSSRYLAVTNVIPGIPVSVLAKI